MAEFDRGAVVKAWRIGLFASGIGLIAVGGVFFVKDLTVREIAGVILWLAAAVALHDAVLVPGFALAGRVLRRTARQVPTSILIVAEAGFAVGALLTAVVVPELIAQVRGPKNPTVVPGDYLLRLGAVWLGIAAIVAVVALVIVWRRRRFDRRESRS
jgi:hypothetical protein